jgi:hypothetical protein
VIDTVEHSERPAVLYDIDGRPPADEERDGELEGYRDNLAVQGELDEAMDLYQSLCDRGGALGLLPEEVDPSDGTFLGNYPQALSHVGLISSGVVLARRLAERHEGAEHQPDEEHEAFHTAIGIRSPYQGG